MSTAPTSARWGALNVRAIIDRWLQARLPRAPQWALTQCNLYVLPSAAGWMLGLTALLLLIAAINYQVNLGFLFTFMLAGATFVSVLMAHGNLRGLTLRALEARAVFAGQQARLPVVLQQESDRTRFAISLGAAEPAGRQVLDLPAHNSRSLLLHVPALARGIHPCPSVTIETLYPIGAFRVWSVWRPAVDLLVYPAPEPHAPPLPKSASAGVAGLAAARSASFDLEGFRSYQRGDPVRSILWKKTATALTTGTGEWVRRDHVQLENTLLWLEYSATGLQQPEAALSRLCAWVLSAQEQGMVYGLRLPHTQIEPDEGPAHMHACLRALATS